MIRILILCEFGTRNGGENSLLAVLPFLAAKGFHPVVAVPPRSELANALTSQGVEIVSWEPQVLAARSDTLTHRRENLQQLIHTVKPSLVHANSLSMSRLCGPVAKAMEIPSMGHLREMMNVSRQVISDLNANKRLLAVSKATKLWYMERGVDVDRMHVLYNGVDLDLFCPGDPDGSLHRELGVSPDVPILGGIGQIGLRKGWEVLLNSLGQVRKYHPQVLLTIVGKRYSQKVEAVQYQHELERLSGRPDLQGHVHFLGRREDVTTLLKEWLMLVHPARQEPMGRVLLEAAASGCPVVATDVGGTREIFPDHESGGILVPVSSAEKLTAGICQLIEEPDLRRSVGQAGRRRAELCFAVADAAEHLVQHYRELAEFLRLRYA